MTAQAIRHDSERESALLYAMRLRAGKSRASANVTFALASLAFLVACQGERTITPLERPAGIAVVVSVAPGLSQAAQLLDWANLAVPNATVIVRTADPDAEAIIDSATTDDGGTTTFATLPAGEYTIQVSRDLSQEERTRASTALGDVYALEGAATAVFDQFGGGLISVSARGVTKGTLVFSEIFPTAVFLPVHGQWLWGSFFELYNNSDAPVELAGKLFVDAHQAGTDNPNFPCSTNAALNRDPEGLWADYIYRFPDDATPLAPGGKVVVATDAIDHRQFGEGGGFHDLSAAEYEFRGSSDTDNPTAKDVVSLARVHPFGHGWVGFALRNVIAIAESLSLDTLPRQTSETGSGIVFLRIPAAALIDVLQWQTTFQGDYPYCPSAVLSEIDASEPRIIDSEGTLSMHRRVRNTRPDGRPVLQKSRNSAADWIAGPGTPHQVP